MDAKQKTETLDFEFKDFSDLARLEKKRTIAFPYKTSLSLLPIVEYLKVLKKTANTFEMLFIDAVLQKLEEQPDFLKEDKVNAAVKQQPEILSLILSGFFTPIMPGRKLGYAVSPFTNELLHATPEFLKIFESGEYAISMHLTENEVLERMITNVTNIILNQLYGQQLEHTFPEGLTLINKTNGLETHYKFNPITDFVKVIPIKPLLKLDMGKIRDLLKRPFDSEAWIKIFPPDRFEFQGLLFMYLTDITDQEIVSRIKNKLLGKEKMRIEEEFNFLQQQIRSLFRRAEVEVGFQTPNQEWRQMTNLIRMVPGLSRKPYPPEQLSNSIYHQPLESLLPYMIADLKQLPRKGPIEEDLLKQGIRSLMLVPVLQMDGEAAQVILEIGSNEPDAFTHGQLTKLRELLSILSVGMERKREHLANRIRLITQKHFTNIHPSVQWKFREVAMNILFQERSESGHAVSIEPIRLEKVYPLYGQADIVGSSTHRNESILSDLNLNLERVAQLLEQLSTKIKSNLIDFMAENVCSLIEKLETSFSPNDETQVLNLLRDDIHPYLQELAINFPKEAGHLIEAYFKKLDANLGVIYWERKAFEESVSLINDSIARLLQDEDEEMQAFLPHYFEKYKTDGVEYNIYLGQSILKEKQFTINHLREFRLWQLKHMCKITRLVAGLQDELLVPLTTAQLIFVYSDPLDICFRMDEKLFDVDGAYNVRYEILKKRIDKAYILNTDERLTVAGKIAIVYLHHEDREEYMDYLQYLVRTEEILPEIEDFELSKMQGVEGLKALRVTVA
ncbi:MAG: hypothetical protein DHS20C18_05310 [Saprospiraceae bacterium]|nr:MAG: hypothetical protein DHS20C18_05310 [Saprospiraceae bacterium]